MMKRNTNERRGLSCWGIALMVQLLAASALADPAVPQVAAAPSEAAVAEPQPGEPQTAENEPAPANPFRIRSSEPREGDHFVDYENPVASVPTPEERDNNPQLYAYYLQELVAKGLEALERKDYDKAVELYRAMALSVPDSPLGWVRLCEAEQARGQFGPAEVACAKAIEQKGATVADSQRYVELVLKNRPGYLQGADLDKVDTIVASVGQIPESRAIWASLACQIGARLEDPARLRPCAEYMEEHSPHSPQTITYGWALAFAERDYWEMRREQGRAVSAGLPPVALERMEQGAELVRQRQLPRWLMWGAAAILTVVGGVVSMRLLRRRRSVIAHA